jgi:mRNA interferase MazF
MITYKFGDILLVPISFTDFTGNKQRPAVVINSNEYQKIRPDIILMSVTSQIKKEHVFGETFIHHWEEAGLLKPSIIKPVITTLQKTLILKKLGTLHSEDKTALLKTFQIIFSDK